MDEVITSPVVTNDNAFCNFSFSKWWPSNILDSFGAYQNHPRRLGLLVVFIVVQNLVVINAAVSIT